MLWTVRDTLKFRKTTYKTTSSKGPYGINITHTPCKMTKLAYFNNWHVVAKLQHPGIWRRMINVANHRAIKTSKGNGDAHTHTLSHTKLRAHTQNQSARTGTTT